MPTLQPVLGPYRVTTEGGYAIDTVDGERIANMVDLVWHTEPTARLLAGSWEMYEALMAVSLHLLVRPQARLPGADENVRALVRAALAKVRGAK